jgi:nucleoside phosphorylase
MESIVPSQKVDVLVVAAHGPDLRGLRNQLGDRLDGNVRGMHVTGKTIGVGMGVAGGATAKRVYQLHPRCVIHVGTCGVYPGLSQYQPHDVVIASNIVMIDHAVTKGYSAIPEPMQTSLSTHSMLSAGLATTGGRTHLAAVGSPLNTTIDDALAADVVGRHGPHVENLEAFAVAHACHLGQVPFACVFGVTHIVGSHGREDWKRFERQSTLSAAEVVITWLMNGAQGVPHG